MSAERSAAEPAAQTVAGRSLGDGSKELAGGSGAARSVAVPTIPEFGQAAVPALIESLNDPQASVRYWGAYALGELKTTDNRAMPP